MNKELVKKLYDYMNMDIDYVDEDINNGYLTENMGRDGKNYIWYLDTTRNVVIDEDGNISTDEEFIKDNFC